MAGENKTCIDGVITVPQSENRAEDEWRHVYSEILGTDGKTAQDIKDVLVSVDAATKETYNVVRRGGNWDALQENIQFLCQLRKQN